MAVEVLVPRLGWSMEEGTLVEWLKHDGDTVQPGDLIFALEGDKALNEVETFESGILRIPPDAPQPGAVVPVGAVLAYIVQPGEPVPWERLRGSTGVGAGEHWRGSGGAEVQRSIGEEDQHGTQPASTPHAPPPTPQHSTPTISPRARKRAEALGVDWTTLQGSGRTGRIVERDVVKASSHSPLQVEGRDEGMRQLSPTRHLIAQRMASSAHTTAPVTLTTEVDATELVRLRHQLKADTQGGQQQASLIPSYTALMVKIVAHALREHPALNARLEDDRIITEPSAHIGIAVDAERGLTVAVLRDAQDKTLRQITSQAEQLVTRAREGKSSAAEMQGSTFTVTNLGMYEIDAFTPIINLPECAILGMGRIAPKQVVTLREGSIDEVSQVSVRHMLVLSLTFDHRLVDGAPAARFLQRVKQLVERPYLWLVS